MHRQLIKMHKKTAWPYETAMLFFYVSVALRS
jgi:hypothetical protein